MTEPLKLTNDIINRWADDKNGSVALHLKQKLIPVEGEGAVIFPPTYADIGYNIDTLSDGTKVATIDSVGSQANRMEPIFKQERFANLVPQITIDISGKDKETKEQYTRKHSIFEVAHRGADAAVHSCPTLAPAVNKAFRALKYRGDAGPLTQLFPTSLVFGVWDSRGGSSEKLPRLVRSTIRAWEFDELHTAAQFTSIRKELDSETLDELKKEAAKKGKKALSDVGLDDAPAIFRKVSTAAEKHMNQFKNGSPNPERRILGGIVVRGAVERDVTVNLVALRKIEGADSEKSQAIRRYLLSLALITATADFDLFLREGCHLRFAGDDFWNAVPRRGEPLSIDLASEAARETIKKYAAQAVEPFKAGWPTKLDHKFDLDEAKKLLAKKGDEEEAA